MDDSVVEKSLLDDVKVVSRWKVYLTRFINNYYLSNAFLV